MAMVSQPARQPVPLAPQVAAPTPGIPAGVSVPAINPAMAGFPTPVAQRPASTAPSVQAAPPPTHFITMGTGMPQEANSATSAFVKGFVESAASRQGEAKEQYETELEEAKVKERNQAAADALLAQFPEQTNLAKMVADGNMEVRDAFGQAYQERQLSEGTAKERERIAKGANYLRNAGKGEYADMLEAGVIGMDNIAGIMRGTPEDLPADVQKYNLYVDQETQAGRQPLGWLDYNQAMKGNGLSITTNPDGTTTIQQGGPGVKLTEGQAKDIGFYTRGLQANQGLTQFESELTDWTQQNVGAAPLGLGNYMRTPEFRQAKVEADQFLAAVLRKDTGAAITDKEFEIYGPMFLPVPGDDPQTVALKRQKRSTALLAIRSGLGTAEAVAAANEDALGLALPDASGEQITATNPETGEVVVWNGTEWVPQ